MKTILWYLLSLYYGPQNSVRLLPEYEHDCYQLSFFYKLFSFLLATNIGIIKRPWKGAYLFSPQFPRRRRIMVSLEYLPYY